MTASSGLTPRNNAPEAVLLIRGAVLADVPALVGLEQQCFDPAVYDLSTRRQFRYLIAKANAHLFVCEDTVPGSLCGWGGLLMRRGSSMVRFFSLAIHPEQQGRGIGKRMFAYAEDYAKAKGHTGVLAEVRADNTGLLELYRKRGYQVLRRMPGYFPDGAEGLKMSLYFNK